MKKKIAYIVSRFPTVSETFILYEIIELQKFGVEIDIFPLIHQQESVIHAEVELLTPQVHYISFFSLSAIRDHLFWFHKTPTIYIQTLLGVILKNMRSIKFLSRALIVILLSAQFARRIEELGIEHIHAHSATHPTLMAYIIWRLTRIPYSFTAHSTDIYFNQTMLSEKIDHASFVATISEYNRNFLQNTYPNIPVGKIKIIHCGIDPAKFQKKTKQGISNSFNIICVARLEKIKGHIYLIEACALLKAQNVDFNCYLVGDGELHSQVQEQINRLNLIHAVKILGFQPHEQVVDLLAQADILVLPSISEGIPVSAMEAMATGIPVIATSVTGVPELVEDGVTGLLVPSQNSRALFEALLKLCNSKKLRLLMGKAGREKVIKEFNLQNSAAALYNIFINEVS
jgi:colanic acid/amylovoran biosynthesis glycosyltransferase